MKARIMKGIPGSGKSTKAEEIARLNKCQIISKDIIRDMYPNIKEDEVREKENELIGLAAQEKRNIIVDNTHMNMKSLASVVAFCQTLGYEMEIVDMVKFFKNPYEYHRISTDRNMARQGKKRVPQPVIDEMFLSEYPTETAGVGEIYIFDIDGTIADGSHREHYVNNGNKDWKSYFDEMLGDSPIYPVVNILNKLKQHNNFNKIIIVSGRPDSHYGKTQRWLDANGIKYDFILMRKSWDNRKDTLVKEDLYNKCLKKEHLKIQGVWDDRKCVIDMRKSKGLYVFNCSLKENNDF